MPTKHIDDASYALAEENLVKAVVLTKTAVKESEMLALLIRKGAETLKPVDILTHLAVSPNAWGEIFHQVLAECGAHYPEEYLDTLREFREKAEMYSATWKEYGTDAIHQHICDAGRRLHKLSEIKFLQLEPYFEYDSEEEKQDHERRFREQLQKMDDALEAVSGTALGSLTDEERLQLELMMESPEFQVRFRPLLNKRRSDGRYDFTVYVSRFPNVQQATLLEILNDLKSVGLSLTWHRSELYDWLQEHVEKELDDLVFSLFTPLDNSVFSFTGDYKQALTSVKASLKDKGVSQSHCIAVTALLKRLAKAADE